MTKVVNSSVKVESLNKASYKLLLYSVKVIPIVISGIYLLNTIFSYFNVDTPVFSYAVQFLFIGMLYSSSYVFKFCPWHRMFIHYILIVFVLNIVDYHIGLPLSDRELFIFYIILTTLFMFIVMYLGFNHEEFDC